MHTSEKIISACLAMGAFGTIATIPTFAQSNNNGWTYISSKTSSNGKSGRSSSKGYYVSPKGTKVTNTRYYVNYKMNTVTCETNYSNGSPSSRTFAKGEDGYSHAKSTANDLFRKAANHSANMAWAKGYKASVENHNGAMEVVQSFSTGSISVRFYNQYGQLIGNIRPNGDIRYYDDSSKTWKYKKK